MANHKQAIKRHRQSLVRAERNQHFRSTTRTLVKRARQALEAGDKAAATEAVDVAVKVLDRVAGKGIIPAKRAARLKSRMVTRLNAL